MEDRSVFISIVIRHKSFNLSGNLIGVANPEFGASISGEVALNSPKGNLA
ncbi:hypothetical protein RDI58_001638 [Solanum bulbocastanum]|uniref:Uncharacterized protein n=1 Tax=Solanum bulbocastanum TaxID=147425 RepID=A0AAN8U5G6_SOLBU